MPMLCMSSNFEAFLTTKATQNSLTYLILVNVVKNIAKSSVQTGPQWDGAT